MIWNTNVAPDVAISVSSKNVRDVVDISFGRYKSVLAYSKYDTDVIVRTWNGDFIVHNKIPSFGSKVKITGREVVVITWKFGPLDPCQYASKVATHRDWMPHWKGKPSLHAAVVNERRTP